MIFACEAFSLQGPRLDNQDRVLLPVYRGDGSVITAIADGVGGEAGGAIAAQIAIDTASRYAGTVNELESVFSDVVQGITSQAVGPLSSMATTLSVALIFGNSIAVGHVGDARIYHVRNHGLVTITEDQTELAELVRRGILTSSQARRYRRKGVLTSALSRADDHTIYQSFSSFRIGDSLLLLTDGAYQKLPKKDIVEILTRNESVSENLSQIRLLIEKNKPSDNYSAIIMRL